MLSPFGVSDTLAVGRLRVKQRDAPIAYAPTRLLDRVASAEAAGGVLRFPAALLVVDIVGSTALTDRFGARGSREVERLGELLRLYFADCIESIEACGGEIARIDGDAIIAIWPADEGPAAAVRAAATAGSRLRGPSASAASPGIERVRHRLTLDYGELQAFALGEAGLRRFLILSGAPFRRLGSGVLRGEPQELIVSRQAVRHMPAEADLRPVGVAASRLAHLPEPEGEPPEPRAPQAFSPGWRDFMPAVVRGYEDASQEAWLPEFRQVSAVYLNLKGVRADTPWGQHRVTRAYAAAHSVVEAFNMTFSDIIEGDKGVVFKLTCGLPGFGREHNAGTAAAIALRLDEALRAVGESAALGLASGFAFCGVVGGPTRREYIAIGSALNYGARLMQAARRGVLCDAVTAEAIGSDFKLGPARTIEIVGRGQPLEVRRVAATTFARAPTAGSGSGEICGREIERACLEARVRDHAAGAGASPLVFEGEPGAGKTSLLAYAEAIAAAGPLRVVRVTATSVGMHTPLFLCRQIITELYAPRRGGGGATGLERAIRAAMAGDPSEPRLGLLGDILRFEDAGGDIGQMEGAARREALEALLVRLIGLGGPRLLLLADDLQWLDAASARVLREVALGGSTGVLLIGASRPVEGEGAVDLPGAERLALGRLDRHVTDEVIRKVLGADRASRRLVDFVWSRSEGLPLHAQQLILALRDRGLVRIANRRCELTSEILEAPSGPASLRNIVVSRLDLLRAGDQILIKVASVIGLRFDAAMLSALQAGSRGRSAAGLQRLVDAGFLVRVEREEFAFTHSLLRDSVYDVLTYRQRRTLHRQIAERIEENPGDEPSSRFAVLAEHWEQADEAARAIDHRLAAAEFALLRYAHDDALDHLARAERLAGAEMRAFSSHQRLRWFRIRADAYQELSRFADAETAYSACARILRVQAPRTTAGKAAGAAAVFALRAIRPLVQALRRHDHGRVERDRMAAHVLMRLAEHGYFNNDALQVLYCTVTSLHHGELAGSARETTVGYGGLAVGLGVSGLDRLASTYAHRCIAAASAMGGRHEQGLARLITAAYSFSAGRWEETASRCREGVEIFGDLGETFRRQSCDVIGAYVSLATGDHAVARQSFDSYGAGAVGVENEPVRAWILAGRAALALIEDADPAAALSELLDVRRDRLHASERLLCESLEAALWRRASDPGRARDAAERALATMQAAAPTIGIGFIAIPLVADVLIDLAIAEPLLLTKAKAAGRAVDAYAYKIRAARPRAALVSGRLALAQGHQKAAQAHWRRGLAAADQLQMPLEAELCRRMLSQIAV